MIGAEDVASVLEVTGRETYWTRQVKQYAESNLGKDACDKLKEAILLDFLAWGLLGSFLTSVAFGMVACTDLRSDGPATLFSLYAAYIVVSVYAALMSLHSVIAGTWKYITFVHTPSSVIVPAINDYLLSQMNSGMETQKSPFQVYIRWFIPYKWDHMTPLLNSVFAICMGCAIAVQMVARNEYITFVIVMICYSFITTIRSMREDIWKRQRDYQSLRPLLPRSNPNRKEPYKPDPNPDSDPEPISTRPSDDHENGLENSSYSYNDNNDDSYDHDPIGPSKSIDRYEKPTPPALCRRRSERIKTHLSPLGMNGLYHR